LFAYTRTLGADQFLIALNFSTNTLPYVLPNGIKTGRLLLSNLAEEKEEDASTISLKPWEARVYRL
jgi:oligo-1,6-glucosidase